MAAAHGNFSACLGEILSLGVTNVPGIETAPAEKFQPSNPLPPTWLLLL